MFKIQDVKVATAMLIGGFIRGHEGDAASASPEHLRENEQRQLGRCLEGILNEVGDWAENLPEDHPVNAGSLKGIKPYELAQELVALVGWEESHRIVDQAIKADREAVEAAEQAAADRASAAAGLSTEVTGVVHIAGVAIHPEVAKLLDASAAPAPEAKMFVKSRFGQATAGEVAAELIDALGADVALATLVKAIATPRDV